MLKLLVPSRRVRVRGSLFPLFSELYVPGKVENLISLLGAVPGLDLHFGDKVLLKS